MVRHRQEDDETRNPDAASPEPEDRSADPRDAPTLSFESAPTQSLEPGAPPPGDRGRQSAQEPLHEAGEEVGGHVLRAPLGLGGFGEVWRAEETSSGREVALKLLRPRGVASTDVRERFHREARLAASLGHPNCVFVYGAEEVGGELAVSMELMEGGTLQDVLDAEGRLPFRQAVDAVLQLAAGLEAALEKGIIHRDVKPSNCFLGPSGEAKIGDFGLSKTLGAGDGLTVTGSYIGTPAYSSPEQVRGDELDFRTDVFSLGAVLYHLVTGERPFGSGSPTQVLARIVSEDPPPMAEHGVEFPSSLEDVVRRMLAKDPGERFASYEELRRALLPFGTRALTPASVTKRVGAYLLDVLCVYLLGFLVGEAIFALEKNFGLSFQQDAVSRFAEASRTNPRAYVLLFLLSFGLTVVYFFVQEARWKTTAGKRCFGLRISSADGSTPGAPRIFRRTLAFAAIWSLGGAILDGLMLAVLGREAFVEPHFGLVILQLIILSGVLASTMRKKNGYAALHDVWSGTRVVKAPAEARELSLGDAGPLARPMHAEAPTTPIHSDAAPHLGRFEARSLLWRREREELYEARDPLLDRTVWIYVRDRTADDAVTADSLDESTVRWLEGGLDGDGEREWHAFEAPPGQALLGWIEKCGERRPWSETRTILAETARALDEELEGPRPVALGDIWIEPGGRVRILPFAWVSDEEQGSPEERHPRAELLHAAAHLLLVGRIPRTPLQRVDCPLPRSARRALEGLARGEYDSLAAFRHQLEELAERPQRVTPHRRTVSFYPLAPALLLLTLVVAAVLTTFLAVGEVLPYSARDVALGERLRQWHALADAESPSAEAKRDALERLLAFGYHCALEREAELAAAADELLPEEASEWTEERRESSTTAYRVGYMLARYPRYYFTTPLSRLSRDDRRLLERLAADGTPPSHELTADRAFLGPTIATAWSRNAWALGLIFFIAVPSLLSAGIFRGGFGMLLTRIDVQRQGGRPASRLRCLLRALVAWSPVLLPLLLFGLLRLLTWIDPWTPLLPLLVSSIGWTIPAGLLLLIAGGVYAIGHPERGLQDRIAGTWLMPR